MRILFFLPLIFLASCNSPLLNHKQEKLEDQINAEQADKTIVFKNKKISAEVHWLTPIQVGGAQFDLIFSEDITDDLDVIPWMPEMGHGTSPVEITFLSPSHATVKDVFFIMAGLWNIKIQLKKADRVLDEVILSYRL